MEQLHQSKWHRGIGLMSGTSLDGVDLACCSFWQSPDQSWEYCIEQAETIAYPDEWSQLLFSMPALSGSDLIDADRKLGLFYGKLVADFCERHHLQPEFVASHGHTIFHRPDSGFTYQAGHGGYLAIACGLKVVCDFRSQDVALGGQGAPLVPIGDALLFGKYDALINLGGFANISMKSGQNRLAWDICPVNIVLNELAQRQGQEFDLDGLLARSGEVNTALLQRLNHTDYYLRSGPKSLGREWVEQQFMPIIDDAVKELDVRDIMATTTMHIAERVAEAAEKSQHILATGGGVHNLFLTELLRKRMGNRLYIPEKKLIDFKEAMVFSFLGLLRLEGLTNTLTEATGSSRAVSSGAVFLP